MKVHEFTEKLIQAAGAHVPEEINCDKLVYGDPEMEITKVVSTFIVSLKVLEEAVRLGANLIISHEPLMFFEMRLMFPDRIDEFMTSNPVYHEMKKLLDENHIAVFRFHDNMHASDKDGIYRSLEKEVGWVPFLMPPKIIKKNGIVQEDEYNHFGACYEFPEMTLKEFTDFVIEKFRANGARIVGDPDMKVSRMGLLVGGGSQGLGDPWRPLKLMEARDLHVIVCGEIMELLTPEFVRDMEYLGYRRAMVILGHERTEEYGMKDLGEWIRPYANDIEVIFIDSEEPFTYKEA